ncbi:uncharacterized protein LOC121415153 [Lytechinus variegatus]|uniref:uncharacterized protein LOC121415153 n=1 Tax=Lytechinus variegatus TaxID=7654 RepID=UPI001BB1C34E|nr:uncharacterized protein LOC121415153 [Lytechinus variegatus]
MDRGILKLVFLFILSDALPHVLSRGRFCNNPSPPICADDCDGNGYYVSADWAYCIRCPQCPAGEELNKDCGNGLNGDAACQPCQQGFFSLDTSKRCTPCATCTNTQELEPCQPTQNRVCGECLPGFVRRSGRFSTDPNACLDRCSDLPRDTPQCRDWWANQGEELRPEDAPQENPPVDLDRPAEEVPPDDLDHCEPEPPSCIDHCHDGNFFLDYDGLCKACLTCQPGEQLNKVCGRGKNGDAYCRPCPKGTFSEDGLQRCSPCRICVNTVATECSASRDTQCGECLPGYYQDADGYFPDSGACPNKCPECPNHIPQCQAWCESKKNSDQDPGIPAVPGEPVEEDPKDQVVSEVAAVADIFQSDTDNELNDEAKAPSSTHGTYMTIFIVIVSLLAVVIIVLIIVAIVFRILWKRGNGSTPSTTTETPFIPTPSETPSLSRSPTTVYNPTVSPISSEDGSLEFLNFLRNLSSSALQSLTNPRPVSGESTDMQSAASTPTMNVIRHAIERQKGVEDPSQSIPLLPKVLQQGGVQVVSHGHLKQEEREAYPKEADRQSEKDQRQVTGLGNQMNNSSTSSASGKVVIEKESGTVHPLIDDFSEASGSLVRRRRSVGSALIPAECNAEKKAVNGRNGKQRRMSEGEAALHPKDSSSDDGLHAVQETDHNSAAIPKEMSMDREMETATVSHISETEAKETKPRNQKKTKMGVPGKNLDENATRTNAVASPDDGRTPGVKSPAETNVNIQITLATKDVETVHIGDVHNKRDCHTCCQRAIAQHPLNDDDNEADIDGENEKLLNECMTSSQSDTGYVASNGVSPGNGDTEDDFGEQGKLLDPTSL